MQRQGDFRLLADTQRRDLRFGIPGSPVALGCDVRGVHDDRETPASLGQLFSRAPRAGCQRDTLQIGEDVHLPSALALRFEPGGGLTDRAWQVGQRCSGAEAHQVLADRTSPERDCRLIRPHGAEQCNAIIGGGLLEVDPGSLRIEVE
ncbi:MAG: hypothetical protein AMS25_04515 [Gemmatimonas sp. SM23_52]|nr:MAG: hypothetical protein AMS25_04515 [Gemmatimonas sp. SM23_52]